MSATLLAAVPLAALTLLCPHLYPLQRTAPSTAAAVWLLALALRALVAVGLAIYAAVELASVGLVAAALDWCWHAVLPDLPSALGFSEHPVAHAVVAVPALLLALSMAWLVGGLVRGSLALRHLLTRTLGRGPLDSTVVADERVLLAVTRWGRGRVLVSDRALEALDADELAAGLMHEHAHLRRGHRPVLLMAALLRALGWPLPGTRAAERELRFHLERDADQVVVRELHDPLSLASAICKAAGAEPSSTLTSLGGHGRVSLRLEELVEGSARRSPPVERGARVLATGLAVAILGLLLVGPAWALGRDGGASAERSHACSHSR